MEAITEVPSYTSSREDDEENGKIQEQPPPKIGAKENSRVTKGRVLVFAVLLVATSVAAAMTFLYASTREHNQFKADVSSVITVSLHHYLFHFHRLTSF